MFVVGEYIAGRMAHSLAPIYDETTAHGESAGDMVRFGADGEKQGIVDGVGNAVRSDGGGRIGFGDAGRQNRFRRE